MRHKRPLTFHGRPNRQFRKWAKLWMKHELRKTVKRVVNELREEWIRSASHASDTVDSMAYILRSVYITRIP